MIVLGFLTIVFAIVYLFIHFIKKIKNKERSLSKKIFYPTLIGGFALLIIGLSMEDGTQELLGEAQEQNKTLTSEIQVLKSDKTKLEDTILELESEHKEKTTQLEADLKEASSEVTKHEQTIASLENQDSKIDSLNQEISEVTSTNEELQNQVNSLESDLASAESAAVASSSSESGTSSSDSSSGSSSEESTASTSAYYKNCTAARDAGAAPVSKGDPGYGTHLDRDGDGIGCE